MYFSNLISYILLRNKSHMTIKTVETGTILTALSVCKTNATLPYTFFYILEPTIKMVWQSNKRKMQQHQIIVFQ